MPVLLLASEAALVLEMLPTARAVTRFLPEHPVATEPAFVNKSVSVATGWRWQVLEIECLLDQRDCRQN